MITFTSDMQVRLIDSMGSDASIVQAARVSLSGENDVDMTDVKSSGLINYLMRKKHGSPFEHTALKFYVKAPIFVFREFHRHRVGFSYNEMSGRYTTLLPEFYLPHNTRPLVNIGTSANPKFHEADPITIRQTQFHLKEAYETCWANYQDMLNEGVANEVARMCLPVGIMSQMYVTCNARSLMHFLSLRTSNEEATFPSNPQLEIEMVATQMEDYFKQLFPLVWNAYNERGRVAP